MSCTGLKCHCRLTEPCDVNVKLRRAQDCAPLSQFLASVPQSASQHSLTNWTTLVATLDSLDLIGFMIAPTPSMFLIPSDHAVAALQAASFGAPCVTSSPSVHNECAMWGACAGPACPVRVKEMHSSRSGCPTSRQ